MVTNNSILILFFFQVARMLNRHHKSVQQLWRKFQVTGSVADIARRPKRRVTTVRQDRHIRLSHCRRRFTTATSTAHTTVGHHGRHVSPQTVINRLRESGLRARRPYVGLVLTRRHRQHRLRWARQHVRWTRADWANVLFTDESRFNLRRSDGRARVYRRRRERFHDACVVEKDQYGGGSVMIWAGFSQHTKTNALVIVGNLNAARYQNEILRPVAIPHIRENRGMIFMQDNARPHTARTTLQLLQENNVRTLDWPACSPDLNPIEHVWDEVDRRVRQRGPHVDLAHLEADVINCWNSITQRYLRNYATSMRARCLAVIQAEGGHTRY